MVSQQTNKPRRFKAVLIYMVEERTKEKIGDLYEQLQARGIEVFLFSENMPLTEDHAAEMESKIKGADSVIICYSENFEKGRGYRHQEVRIALEEQRKRPPGNAYLITICLDKCEVPSYLSKARILDYFGRSYFAKIMRLGLQVQRNKLIEQGEKIQDFNSQEYPIEETILQGDTLLPRNRAESSGIWNVPYLRNPYFTGRDELLARLDQQLSPIIQDNPITMRRAALTQPQAIKGLGGIGKTQIAVEFAYRSRDQGHYTHTLWINAASEDTIMASCVTLADLLPAFSAKSERDQHKLVAAIKHWLEQCEQHWLLIFDNADDVSIIQDYLPQQGNGSILLTTRANAVGSLATSIEVETMSFIEGTHLLLRRAQHFEHASDEEINEAGNIVVALDHFPLALDQAGAYIEETKCRLVDYLEVYQSHRKTLLARRGQQTVNYPDSVATTWSLSFQKVEKANPAAAELLRLCTFLAPDRIPEELLKGGAAHWPPSLQQAVTDLFSFSQMIEELLKFSLVKRFPEDHMLSIHRLVQAVQMDTMELDLQRTWAERVVLAVNQIFPDKSTRALQDEEQYRRYLDQAQACHSLLIHHKLLLLEGADLLTRAGRYIRAYSPDTAEPVLEHAFEIREQRLEADHLALASSLFDLATSYSDARRSSTRGKFGKAEQLFLQALKIQEQQLGAEHLDIAFTLDGLANLYIAQGKYAEAESISLRSLHIMEQTWGYEDPRLAEYLNGMALLYTIQGKYIEAEPFSQRYDRIRDQKTQDGSIEVIATGVLEQDLWQSSLQSLRDRPE